MPVPSRKQPVRAKPLRQGILNDIQMLYGVSLSNEQPSSTTGAATCWRVSKNYVTFPDHRGTTALLTIVECVVRIIACLRFGWSAELKGGMSELSG
jgi:hypothetical protein